MIPHPRRRYLYVGLAITGLIALALADIEIATTRPGSALAAIAAGILAPDLGLLGESLFWRALGTTVAVALWGTLLGGVAGALLAIAWRWRAVRIACAAVRSIHELLWALLLLPAFGSSALTGVLALALPAAGFFAKIFAEIRQEADPAPERGLPARSGALSRWCWGVLPVIAPACRHYIGYRFECGLRASVVLGFIGIHTIGFELESYAQQNDWPQVTALLLGFIATVAATRWLLRPISAAVLTAAALPWLALVGPSSGGSWSGLARYAGELVPWPLRRPAEGAADALGVRLAATGEWLWDLVVVQGLPALASTVLLGLAAGVLATFAGLALAPVASRGFLGRIPGRLGDLALIVVRTVPAYVLAYVAVLVCGSSMLPGIIALAVHNAAILGHLSAETIDRVPPRTGGPRRRLDRLGWEILPRIAGSHLAYALYRFEFVLRESAILGVIGIATIGFLIDDGIQEHKPDEALVFVVMTALMIIVVDALSDALRAWARLRTTPWRE